MVVLLLAHRYGYRPTEGNPDRKSITQLEIEEAGRDPSKPRLVFTVDPEHDWKQKWIDQEDKDRRDLAAFRAEVESRHGKANFTDPDQLASLVLQALRAREERAASRTYTPTDLDAWVAQHHQALERAFCAIPAVQHLEPVLADGSAHVLLISADGGAGKTSLAFRIAHREGAVLSGSSAGSSPPISVSPSAIAPNSRARWEIDLSPGTRAVPRRLR